MIHSYGNQSEWIEQQRRVPKTVVQITNQIWLGTPHGTPHRAMMRRSRVAALALVVIFAVAGATAQGEVVTLTDATFEHATQASSGQTTGVFFVKFYAPWCGHCRAMAATWSELAAELDGTGVVIADLDATQNPATTDRFNAHVKGFPTLLLFRDKKVFKHAGARDLESLKRFATVSYVDSTGHDVPPPPGAFATYFSVFTKTLAVIIIDTHQAFQGAMATASKDFGSVSGGWRERGVGGFTATAKTAAAASPRMYGTAMLLVSVVGICFAILLALVTAPTRKHATADKKND